MDITDFKKGKWYKDDEGDFIKFDYYDDGFIYNSARIYVSQGKKYEKEPTILTFSRYTYSPMSIEEMKKHLPEEECWVEETNDLFPIY
jgi:hypothetical protein